MRGDANCTFKRGCFPRPTFAVNLKALETMVTLPKNLLARVAQEKGILPSGPGRTFLKPGRNLSYIPSSKRNRMKDAPNTVFVRCLYLSKEDLDGKTKEVLQKACKQILRTCKENTTFSALTIWHKILFLWPCSREEKK